MPIKFTPSSLIEVWRDGELVSSHGTEREAVEAIVAHAETADDGDYEIRPFTVKVNVKRRIIGPDAPALGSVVTVSDTALNVTLDRAATGPTRIDRYELERLVGSTWTQIASGIAIFGAGNAYPDTGLSPDTTYNYRCRAVDTTQRASEYGYALGATSPSAGAPSAPENFTAVWSDSTTVGLTWDVGSTGSVPDDYDIDWSLTGTGGWNAITFTGTANSYSHTGRTAGVTYYYRIKAKLGALSSAYATTYTPSTSIEVMHDVNFASGSFPPESELGTSGTATGRSVRNDGTARVGTYYARFDLLSSVGERMELASRVRRTTLFSTTATAPTPHEQWLGFSIRPVNFVADTQDLTLMQFHGNNAVDLLGNTSVQSWPGPPTSSLGIANNQWVVTMRNTIYVPTDALRPDRGAQMNVIYNNSRSWTADNNHWVDWVYHIVWDWRTSGTGLFECWMRGQSTSNEWLKVVNYRGGTGSNNYTDTWRGCLPYWKFGIYKPNWGTQTQITFDYDALKLVYGSAAFADVAPSGTPS